MHRYSIARGCRVYVIYLCLFWLMGCKIILAWSPVRNCGWYLSRPPAVTRLLIKRMLAWGRPGLPPSGPVVPYRPSARPQRPTRGTRGHFVDGERKKKLMYFHGSERVLRLLYGAEVGQAAVGTRCGVGEPNQAAIDRNEASRGCRRCRRRGSRRRATSRGAPPMPAAAAEEETSPVGARRAPLCPSATASRSDRGSPFASEFVLSPRALDWVAPIRAPRSLIRCAVVTWIVSPCSVITEVMRNTSIEKFLIALEPLIRRVVRPPFLSFTICPISHFSPS